jgi:hyperosmotically inducible periplasmic protein
MKKIFAFSLLLLTAFALACKSDGTNSNRSTTVNLNSATAKANDVVSDGWITTKVKVGLIGDKRTSGFETTVDTKDGVVTLSGKVDTAEAKTAATEVAKDIKGVKSVDNQLQVVPEAKRKEINEADDKIEGAVKTAINSDAKLKDASLSPKVNAGVVTLDGSVDTQDQLYAAAQEIRAVPGVKSVDTKQVKVKNEK